MNKFLFLSFILLSVFSYTFQLPPILVKHVTHTPTAGKRLNELENQRAKLVDDVTALTRDIGILKSNVNARDTSDLVSNEDVQPPYRIHKNVTVSYAVAMYVCHLQEGRLVVLDSVEKFEMIRSAVKGSNSQCFWVGAKRDSDGRFSTWNDGSIIRDEIWGSGEPNYLHEKCANLLDKHDFKLNDDKCSNDCNFVCESPIS